MDPIGWAGNAIGRFGIKIAVKRVWRKGKRWFYHHILDEKTTLEKYQEAARRRDELAETTRIQEERIEAKEQQIEDHSQEISEVRRDLSVKERLLESLDIDGISRQELIRKNLDEPTPFLFVRTGGQKPKGPDGEKWVKEKLKRKYGAKVVGSSYVIPPDNFPESLLTGKSTLLEWVDEELDEEDKQANFAYVTWSDMEQGELYWRRDYGSGIRDMDDVFPMEELTDKDFYDFDEVQDALQLVKKGDIAFFAARFADEDEIEAIHGEQAYIEEELGNPTLKQLANQTSNEEIRIALEDIVADPSNVANGISQEAEIWYAEIYGSEGVEAHTSRSDSQVEAENDELHSSEN